MRDRYAVSRTSNDRYPIYFRNDCERTLFDLDTGKDKSLVEVVEELDSRGYDLIDRQELDRRFDKNGAVKQPKGDA